MGSSDDNIANGSTAYSVDILAIAPPIGAIVPWLKSFTGVPQTLPLGYVECDGATLSDSDSPMDGEAMPDLNASDYLRGSTTSGSTTAAVTYAHCHSISLGSSLADYGAVGSPKQCENPNTETTGQSGGPPHYTVIFIIRVK